MRTYKLGKEVCVHMCVCMRGCVWCKLQKERDRPTDRQTDRQTETFWILLRAHTRTHVHTHTQVNNGRLAMLCLFGYFCESKIPGSVPALTQLGVVQPYSGEYMVAFSWYDVFSFFLERSDFNSGVSDTIREYQ